MDDDGTVTQVRQIVVNQRRMLGEVLSKKILARIDLTHEFALMVKIAQAGRIVYIGLNRHLCLFSRHQVGRGLLGQEIAAHLGIRIERTGKAGSPAIVHNAECHRAVAVETDLAIGTQNGHLFQVVGCSTVEQLIDAVAANTVDMDLGRIVESHCPKLVVGDFIDTVLGNRHLHPFARGKLGLCRII